MNELLARVMGTICFLIQMNEVPAPIIIGSEARIKPDNLVMLHVLLETICLNAIPVTLDFIISH